MSPAARDPARRLNLWGVSMVRNEADIIEAFVRHNLTVLDGMLVVDHGSNDATLRILQQLAGERLRVEIFASDEPGYHQEEITSAAVRRALRDMGADFAFPLDADEFLKVPSRAELERALGFFPPGIHGLLRWLTYVPAFATPETDTVAILGRSRRLATERHIFHKAVVARHLLDAPDAMLASGNHYVAPRFGARSEHSGKHARIREHVAAIAHVPIRSGAQFVAKVAIKKLGRIAAGYDWVPDAASQAAYEAIVANRPIDPATLLEHAVNWSVPRDNWIAPAEAELVDDAFLAPIALAYSPPTAADPLPLAAAATERFVRKLADAIARPAPVAS
jgi:hypothetical protein